VSSYQYKRKNQTNNQWNVSSKRKLYTKKRNEFDNQKEFHRLINIAKEIVNKRRIKLSG
jgi:hypothetical protein